MSGLLSKKRPNPAPLLGGTMGGLVGDAAFASNPYQGMTHNRSYSGGWSDKFGVSEEEYKSRLASGWSPQDAMTVPPTPLTQRMGSAVGGFLESRTLPELASMSAIPGVSDIAGVMADYNYYQGNPEERTMGNFALSGLGLLPFIPGMTAVKSADSIGDVQEKIKSKFNLEKFSISQSGDDVISLNMIKVPKESRKKGIGTDAINDLIEYADKTNKRIKLTPSVQGDKLGSTSKSRLVKFYKRLGFVENKGKNKDFAISDSMYRDPK